MESGGQGGRIARGHQRRAASDPAARRRCCPRPSWCGSRSPGARGPGRRTRRGPPGPSTRSVPPGPAGCAPLSTIGVKKFQACCVAAQMSAGFFASSICRNSSLKNASLPTAPPPGGGPTRIWAMAVLSTPTGGRASRVMRSWFWTRNACGARRRKAEERSNDGGHHDDPCRPGRRRRNTSHDSSAPLACHPAKRAGLSELSQRPTGYITDFRKSSLNSSADEPNLYSRFCAGNRPQQQILTRESN